MDQPRKTFEQRLSESLEIRKQLREFGFDACASDEDRERMAGYMNEFVRHGVPVTFKVRISDMAAKVTLSASAGRQSGVVMQMP